VRSAATGATYGQQAPSLWWLGPVFCPSRPASRGPVLTYRELNPPIVSFQPGRRRSLAARRPARLRAAALCQLGHSGCREGARLYFRGRSAGVRRAPGQALHITGQSIMTGS